MATKYGFNITIGADTTAFSNALKKLNEPIRQAQNDIKRLNDGLKLNPGNADLLATKYNQLGQSVTELTRKYEQLKMARTTLEREANGNYTEEQWKTLQKLNGEIAVTREELIQAKKEYESFGSVGLQQVSALGSKMKEIGDSIADVGRQLIGVSTAVAGVFGVGINYNIEIEKTTRAFEVFTGSVEEAEEIVSKIRKDSKESIFDTTSLLNANKLLVASGIDAEKSRKAINDMADVLALAGGSNDELNRMAYNLQQIANNGKATARDIRQFGDAGIPIYKMLSDSLGLTNEEVREMDITFDALAETFAKATEEGSKFANGQKIIAETTGGSINVLKKNFTEALGGLTETLMPTITNVINKVNEFLVTLQNLDPGTKKIITNIGLFLIVIAPALIIIGKVISSIGIILTLIPQIVGVLGVLFTNVKYVISGIGVILKGLFTLIMAHPVILVITAIVGVLIVLYNKCEWFREAVNNVIKKILVFIMDLGDKLKTFFTETIPNFIKKAIEVFQNLPYYIGLAMGWVLGKIIDFGKDAWNWVTQKLPEIIHGIIDWFKTLPQRIPEIIDSVYNKFLELKDKMLEVGKNIVEGLWNGIKNAKDWLFGKIGSFVTNIVQGFKEGLGIHSPSKVFEEVIGKNIALGIGEGFEDNLGKISKDMVAQVNGIASDINVKGAEGVTLNFYPQQMTEGDLEMAFNYVNRRFGTQY